jgi:hypothetical protein
VRFCPLAFHSQRRAIIAILVALPLEELKQIAVDRRYPERVNEEPDNTEPHNFAAAIGSHCHNSNQQAADYPCQIPWPELFKVFPPLDVGVHQIEDERRGKQGKKRMPPAHEKTFPLGQLLNVIGIKQRRHQKEERRVNENEDVNPEIPVMDEPQGKLPPPEVDRSKKQDNRPDDLRVHAIGFLRLLQPSGKTRQHSGDCKAEDEANQYPQMTVCIHWKRPLLLNLSLNNMLKPAGFTIILKDQAIKGSVSRPRLSGNPVALLGELLPHHWDRPTNPRRQGHIRRALTIRRFSFRSSLDRGAT